MSNNKAEYGENAMDISVSSSSITASNSTRSFNIADKKTLDNFKACYVYGIGCEGKKKVKNCVAGCKRARRSKSEERYVKKICPESRNVDSLRSIDEKLCETRLSSDCKTSQNSIKSLCAISELSGNGNSGSEKNNLSNRNLKQGTLKNGTISDNIYNDGLNTNSSVKSNTVRESISNKEIASDANIELAESSLLNIDNLPSSLLLKIFSYLPVSDLLTRVSLVCLKWNSLAKDGALWRDLNLDSRERVDDEVLVRLSSYSSNVHSLNLTSCSLLSEKSLIQALQQCPNLQKLVLMRCDQFKDSTLSAIGQFCNQLTYLDLSSCCSLTDTALTTISLGCGMLTDVRLSQCRLLTDVSVIHLIENCLHLKHLRIDQCYQVTQLVLIPVLRRRLGYDLETTDYFISDKTLDSLVSTGRTLVSFNAMDSPFSATALVEFIKHTGSSLCNLLLSNVIGVTPEVVECIVSHCRDLRLLNLSLCSSVTANCFTLLARHCQRLHTLYAVACNVNDSVLSDFARHCSSLETLDVGWCPDVTVVGARELSSRCSKLRYCGLMRCDQVTDAEALSLVKDFPHVHFSTMMLDCRRVLDKARSMGVANTAPPTNKE